MFAFTPPVRHIKPETPIVKVPRGDRKPLVPRATLLRTSKPAADTATDA